MCCSVSQYSTWCWRKVFCQNKKTLLSTSKTLIYENLPYRVTKVAHNTENGWLYRFLNGLQILLLRWLLISGSSPDCLEQDLFLLFIDLGMRHQIKRITEIFFPSKLFGSVLSERVDVLRAYYDDHIHPVLHHVHLVNVLQQENLERM